MGKNTRNKFTIVIPTYNRPRKLRRALFYYEKYNAPVLVADGSDDPCSRPLPGNAGYLHLPDVSMGERIYRALCEVTTEYTCFAADDDFVSPVFVERACELMATRPDVSSVIGKIYGFKEKKPEDGWKRVYEYVAPALQSSAKERLLAFGAYFILFYAPARTDLLRDFFREMAILPTRYARMAELMHNVRLASAGKIMLLDEFHIAREIPEAFPTIKEMLGENPGLRLKMDEILARWFDDSGATPFTQYVLDPYNAFCSRNWPPIGIIPKAKRAIRHILGDTKTERLKRFLRTHKNEPCFMPATDFDAADALKEIEEIVTRDLEGIK